MASWLLLYVAPGKYIEYTQQNAIVEILTALFLFLAGIRLIFFNWDTGKRLLPSVLGVALIIAAFEEMNWAKPYFDWDFKTLVDYIDIISIGYLLDTVLLFLVAIMAYLYVMKKRNFLDYQMPDFSLLLMFLMTAFYRPYDTILGFYLLLLIPLGMLFYTAYRNQKKPELIKCLAALIMILGTYRINSNLVDISNIPIYQLAQFKELLFSFITLAYSLFLVKEERMPTPFDANYTSS